jgi:hypothetical protein
LFGSLIDYKKARTIPASAASQLCSHREAVARLSGETSLSGHARGEIE